MSLPRLTPLEVQALTARGRCFVACGPCDTPTARMGRTPIRDVTRHPEQHERMLYRHLRRAPRADTPVEQKHLPPPPAPR